jgi:hypothetical protein
MKKKNRKGKRKERKKKRRGEIEETRLPVFLT